MVGGEGTSDWGVKTFGEGGSQQSVSGQGNLIQMKGGRRRRRKGSRKGGYGLTQVMVPAALMAANYAYGNRSSMRIPKFGRSKRRSSRRGSRRRGSRRFRR
jgi:hypothetical protein